MKKLAELEGPDILYRKVDDRPGVAGSFHFAIAVTDAGKQGAARLFEIAQIIAMPDDVHRVEIVELRLEFDFRTDHERTTG